VIAIADLLKGYYKDRETNPWHQIYKNIQSYWQKEFPKEDVSETLLLLREAVFGALDILSFGLISDISTQDVLSTITSESNWITGKRRVRNLCIDVAEKLIAKGEVRYLLPSALKRDDFSFLIPRIEDVQWENFLKAKPKITRGKLDLSKLEKSILGSTFLREQMIMETKLSDDDPRVPVLLEAYELQMLEIEVNRSNRVQPPALTEQITLNGGTVQEIAEEKEVFPKKRKQAEFVAPLTDFLEEPNKKAKNKIAEKPVKKNRGKRSK
jgi:hypothetical protein